MKSKRKLSAKSAKSVTEPHGPSKKTGGTQPENSDIRWRIVAVCVFLAGIIFITFGQTGRFPFVNYDDSMYVYGDSLVTQGLTLRGAGLAFSAHGMDNWVPLTTLSHMLDCQIFGLKAGVHHLTNVLLHTANAILLFLMLHRLTSALWRSALVAILFAIHPLGVESVAWISERKDVLSGLFYMLTLWAYAGYARNRSSIGCYLAALFFFLLGLMSKPMLVTVPFVLLLLDVWPFERVKFPGTVSVAGGDQKMGWMDEFPVLKRLLVEKIPFLFLSGVVCVVTFIVQQKYGAVNAIPMSFMPRVENALVSVARYLGKIFWPINLGVLYPLPGHWPVLLVVFSAGLVAAICWGAIRWRRSFPFIFIGWFWFLGMLVPVIGLVQVGLQSMADRYVYLPQIGLYIALTWSIAELSSRWRGLMPAPAVLAAVVIVALMFSAQKQVRYWADSETLWEHALACAPDTLWQQSDLSYSLALDNLGNALLRKGEVDAAMLEFQKALNIYPNYALAHDNLGDALIQKGEVDEAILEYEEALKFKPDDAGFRCNLGGAFFLKGQVDDAIFQYKAALKSDPDNATAYYNLGNAMIQKGQMDEAMVEYENTLKFDPDNAAAHGNLGAALFLKGRVDEATSQYQEALKMQPDNILYQNNLARAIWQLVISGDSSSQNGGDILGLAQKANELAKGNNPVVLRILAAAEADNGDFPEAIEKGQEALSLALNRQDLGLSNILKEEIAVYQGGGCIRSNSPTSTLGWP